MPTRDISWKRRTVEGERVELCARRVGGRWTFYSRPGRSERWMLLESPPKEDWLELLDGVRRRINRQSMQPAEETRLRETILSRFPELRREIEGL